VRWVDGWAVSRERGRLRLDRHWRQGEHLRVAPWICMLCLFPCGSLQEFFLIVGVGFRKLGPRSLSATPEYVILAGICFPRSEACATSSGCLRRNLNAWSLQAELGACAQCSAWRRFDQCSAFTASRARRHGVMRARPLLMAAGSNQAAGKLPVA